MLRAGMIFVLILVPSIVTAQDNNDLNVSKRERSASVGYSLNRDIEAEFRSKDGNFTVKGSPIWNHHGITVIKRAGDKKLVAISHEAFWNRDAFRLANSRGVTSPTLNEYESELTTELDRAVITALKKRIELLEKRVVDLEDLAKTPPKPNAASESCSGGGR